VSIGGDWATCASSWKGRGDGHLDLDCHLRAPTITRWLRGIAATSDELQNLLKALTSKNFKVTRFAIIRLAAPFSFCSYASGSRYLRELAKELRYALECSSRGGSATFGRRTILRQGAENVYRTFIAVLGMAIFLSHEPLERIALIEVPVQKVNVFDYLTVDGEDRYLLSAHLGPGILYVIDMRTTSWLRRSRAARYHRA